MMIITGTALFRITPLVAVVYCRPMYVKTLYGPVPQMPSQTMIFQCRRMAGQFARRSRHAKGTMTSTATSQRAKVIANGVTCPAMARPMIQLTDQRNAVSVRRRYGEACSGARRDIGGDADA